MTRWTATLGHPGDRFQGLAAGFERNAQDALAEIGGEALGDGGSRDVVIADDFDLVIRGQPERGREEKEAHTEIAGRYNADRRGADDNPPADGRPAAAAKSAAADFDRFLAAKIATLFVG